jgi:hypothetical protein
VVAPLPASAAVAVVDPSSPDAEVAEIPAAGQPAAVARAGPSLLVFDAERRRLARLDLDRRRLAGAQPVATLARREVSPLTVRLGPVTRSGLVRTQRLTIGPTALPAGRLEVMEQAVAAGRISFALSSAGIAPGARPVGSQDGIAVRMTRQPGRLLVRVAFAAGAFVASEVALAADGRSVEVRLTEPTPVVPADPDTPDTSDTDGRDDPPPDTRPFCERFPTDPTCPFVG